MSEHAPDADLSTDTTTDLTDLTDLTSLTKASRRAWGALETLHVLGYFSPAVTEAYVGLGLRPRLAYFPGRAAALGPVGPEVATATFYVFAPWLLEKALPSSWEIASPAQVQEARRRAMGTTLHQVLGDTDVSELLELSRFVCDGLTTPGRPLYAAHAGLEWPEDPLVALWHATTLIREHRGDGHVAVLLRAGLDPVESLVLGGLYTGNTTFLQKTRGWTEEEWQAGVDRMRARGLVDDAGLTEEGVEFRRGLERETDRLALEGWRHLGLEGTQRVVELAAPLRERTLAGGLLPDWVSGLR